MEEEHSKVKDLGRIFNKIMLHVGSNNNNNSNKEVREQKNQGQRRSSSFEEDILTFMGENKRLLNIREQNFADLTAFQVNITVFQANTNASLRNLETQVG